MAQLSDELKRKRAAVKYIWTDETEDKLLDLYEANSHLYDMKTPGYSNKSKRLETLQEFSEELGVPADEVERHLRSLRTQFGRERKELKRHGGDPPRGMSERAKNLLRRLEFLDPHVKVRNGRRRRRPVPEEISSDKYEDLELEATDQTPEDVLFDDYTDDQNQDWSDNCYEMPEQQGTTVHAPRPTESNTEMLQQSMNVLQWMSQTLADTANQDSDEEGLWGKMIVKKLKRIPNQEVKEDMMMHIDQIITQAIRGEWPSKIHNHVDTKQGPLT